MPEEAGTKSGVSWGLVGGYSVFPPILPFFSLTVHD